MTDEKPIKKILIFRLGSIGDFLISLPSLYFIRKKYPQATIGLLTNEPTDPRGPTAASVLDGIGYVDQYIRYLTCKRNLRSLLSLRAQIRSFDAELLVYLASRTTALPLIRDYGFFWLCGFRRIVFPTFNPMRWSNQPPAAGCARWEQEAHRIGRVISAIGSVDIDRPESWDLHLSPTEHDEANRLLSGGNMSGRAEDFRLIALSVGTKQSINDWGDKNWSEVIEGLRPLKYGLVLIGSKEDHGRSEKLAARWQGPVLNLCGKASPRVTAAVLKKVTVLLCHDSGPMHLAASVGTRCVAVFSKRNQFGMWYPFGSGHKIFYPCWKMGTIQSIRPRPVIAAIRELLRAA